MAFLWPYYSLIWFDIAIFFLEFLVIDMELVLEMNGKNESL